ncbi:hypothetical protein OIE69_44415 (plasmid) [Actinacidiphila glaucinigra]|uniref:hypothetical protein n=1 Tax=Actinacidiphila glaucinigra TaxID=235986 RepID=UPI002DD963A3|nr:hypothetical protein [Actinacidiphila glaucinigra]WSD65762.1 hypothetical protein OIE69_43435 [Actinacidiphila glaucinigra]WSD65950.1 hypothetical protein OIE69_44415 [Actinacidiphila glaucinigra]
MTTALAAPPRAALALAPTAGVVPPQPPATATSAQPDRGYAVTVYLNTAEHHYSNGYRPGDPVAHVTRPDGTPLTLTFTVLSVDDAADAAWVVGNRQGRDDTGQDWPSDVRSVSVGDVLAVTAPRGDAVTYLAVASADFTPVGPPATIVPIEGTDATSRPAKNAELTAVLFINPGDRA